MPIVYRSSKGSKLTSDEVDGNFQFLDDAIDSLSSNWGDITGTLSDQTDLQSALDALQSDIDTKPTKYFSSGISLSAGIASTVTHNLGLSNKDAFTIRVSGPSGDSITLIDIVSVDTNSLTITSQVGLTVNVFIVG